MARPRADDGEDDGDQASSPPLADRRSDCRTDPISTRALGMVRFTRVGASAPVLATGIEPAAADYRPRT
ncbi:hypothetical protein K8O93_11530 [Gordonia bronchialis]|uniref:hypothetical protein n=1 Tax=Gordonia bronchialis TaxID=2054 RepID=UPI0037BE2CA1|nr:hypothetical protein K8O93_11530 [Gordonia bronchialis]